MSIIKNKVIYEITKMIREKSELVKHTSFLYFDEPVKFKYLNAHKKKINRVTKSSCFTESEQVPYYFTSIPGTALLEIFSNLKNNKFYFYKTYAGKSYKTRLKNDTK
jgi:hypothetical protein